jgi:hypothetical protein
LLFFFFSFLNIIYARYRKTQLANDFFVDWRRMSQRKSVLNPSLLQSITQAFSQSIPITDQLSNTPTPVVDNTQRQSLSIEQKPWMTLKEEFQAPTPTPRRSSNFLKGCKW